MSNHLAVKVSVRLRNATVVNVGVAILGLAALMFKPVTVARIGNALLRLLKCETRIGHGTWAPFEHGITLEALSQ